MKLRLNYKVLLSIVVAMVLIFAAGCSNATYQTKFQEEAASNSGKWKNSIEWVNDQLNSSITDTQTDEEKLAALKLKAKEVIEKYPNFAGISGKKDAEAIDKNFKVIFIKEDIKKYLTYVDNATVFNKEANLNLVDATKVNTSCFGTTTNAAANAAVNGIENETDIYRIVAIFTIHVTLRTQELEPLHFFGGKEFWPHIFDNLFIYPVGWLLYQLSKIFGGFYIVGLLLTTILVRTIGWPIYAKTNDMSLKMQLMQPDIAKIQEKYANRKDPDSQRAMQMEQAQLYKKYKIGIGGCLMPFLQFPIFMAVFRAISRLPYTVGVPGTIYTETWASQINPKFLGVNLFDDRTGGTAQLIGIIVLIVLVVGTQFLSQKLSEWRQKATQEKSQENIPTYRRQAVKQTNDSQRTMKMMMYFMTAMMGIFVWTSKSGLGVYWFIGNIYSMVQMLINNKMSSKRMEKLKKNHSRV